MRAVDDRPSPRRKLLAAAALTAAIVVGWAVPAFAHVTTDPSSAPMGSEITLRFRVPNEVTNANVVRLDVAFPTDPPLLGVDTEPIPGWTSTITEANASAQTGQVVSEISWVAASGGGTPPGEFQEFPILVQQLPTDGNQVVFKAVQTYSDGSVVRWIDPVVAGQPPPDHPTPILTLTVPGSSVLGGSVPGGTVAGGTGPGGSASAAPSAGNTPSPTVGGTVDTSQLAQKSAVSSADRLGVIGIGIGALGLIVALIAVIRRPGAAKAHLEPASEDVSATP
jgi:periplasmic copper chaperone A